MGLTLGRKYKTRRGEARLVGVDGEWLVWQPERRTEGVAGGEDVHIGERFRTKRDGQEVRAPRRGAVEVRT